MNHYIVYGYGILCLVIAILALITFSFYRKVKNVEKKYELARNAGTTRGKKSGRKNFDIHGKFHHFKYVASTHILEVRDCVPHTIQLIWHNKLNSPFDCALFQISQKGDVASIEINLLKDRPMTQYVRISVLSTKNNEAEVESFTVEF